MHIIHCLTHSDYGGAQAVVLLLAESLTQFHPSVRQTAILPQGGIYVERFKRSGCEVVELPLHSISLATIVRTFRLLRQLNPDVIHSHGKGAGFYCRIIPGFFLQARRFHSYHGFHPPIPKMYRILYNWLERYLLRHTDMIISVSASEAHEVAETFPRHQGRVKTVVNIVDKREVVESSRGTLSSQIENVLLNTTNSFVVTTIGRDDYIKNFQLAYTSSALVLKEKKNVVFLFVGSGFNDPGLRSLQQAFPYNVFALPMIPTVTSVLRRSDVLLLTSRKEGCPLIILESFCLGKPVIGTNVPGISDLVTDGVTGLLCEESESSLSSAIKRIMSDKGLYESMSRNAAAFADTMDRNYWAGEYHSVYSNSN